MSTLYGFIPSGGGYTVHKQKREGPGVKSAERIRKKLIKKSESPALAITHGCTQAYPTYNSEKTFQVFGLLGVSLQKGKS